MLMWCIRYYNVVHLVSYVRYEAIENKIVYNLQEYYSYCLIKLVLI